MGFAVYADWFIIKGLMNYFYRVFLIKKIILVNTLRNLNFWIVNANPVLLFYPVMLLYEKRRQLPLSEELLTTPLIPGLFE